MTDVYRHSQLHVLEKSDIKYSIGIFHEKASTRYTTALASTLLRETFKLSVFINQRINESTHQ